MHSSRSRFCSLASVAVGAAALVLSAQIHAVPQYRVFNLGVISGNNASRAFGLNDQGAIVGVSTGSLGGNRAFFWLFENMYGYNNPFEMQQLAAATATANDINNAGIAVGKKTVGGNETAHSWTLAGGTVTAASLGTLSTGEGEDSEAFAINDAADAVIVGCVGLHRRCHSMPGVEPGDRIQVRA